jgi:hypothetical protein
MRFVWKDGMYEVRFTRYPQHVIKFTYDEVSAMQRAMRIRQIVGVEHTLAGR